MRSPLKQMRPCNELLDTSTMIGKRGTGGTGLRWWDDPWIMDIYGHLDWCLLTHPFWWCGSRGFELSSRFCWWLIWGVEQVQDQSVSHSMAATSEACLRYKQRWLHLGPVGHTELRCGFARNLGFCYSSDSAWTRGVDSWPDRNSAQPTTWCLTRTWQQVSLRLTPDIPRHPQTTSFCHRWEPWCSWLVLWCWITSQPQGPKGVHPCPPVARSTCTAQCEDGVTKRHRKAWSMMVGRSKLISPMLSGDCRILQAWSGLSILFEENILKQHGNIKSEFSPVLKC